MPTPASLDRLQKYIAQTYFGLRLVLAILAFAFPWLLYIGGRLANEGLAPSLSAYYEVDGGLMRDQFVGVLWAVGMMLLAYRGLHWSESIALLVAGVSAVGIASFPCHCLPGNAHHSAVHAFFAVLFFASIAYVCIWCAPDTLPLMPPGTTPSAATFTRIYRIIGGLMIIAPLASVALDHWLSDGGKTVVLAEVAGIYTFASFWCVKSWELGKSDAEHEIARGRVVRVRGRGLVRVQRPPAAAQPSLVYPATVHPGEVAATADGVMHGGEETTRR
jgi:hypothetical protein